MQLISLSKLNNACSNSLQRAVIRQVKSLEQMNLGSYVYCDGQFISRRSNSVRCYGIQLIPKGIKFKFPVVNPNPNPNPSSSHFRCGFESSSCAVSRPYWNVGSFAKPDAVFFGACARHYHVSSSASNADASVDVSVRDEQEVVSADSSACKHVAPRTLKLNSGSCYLPHPDKLKTGGEDAHFICEEKQVIGVADGVGGWAEVGIDAGIYARLLMSNSVIAIKKESKGSVDPAKVLVKAHADTNIMGSSTACIVALTDQGINAINLGDSSFIVIRDGSTAFRSPVQQYGFNFPYQLASGNQGDAPSSGQVFTFPVASGDVLVAGTDGLFDNLFDNEISALVVEAMKKGVEPQITAQNIANRAQQRALDSHQPTPFSTAAHDAGLQYNGGKLDDITVVVSYIAADD